MAVTTQPASPLEGESLPLFAVRGQVVSAGALVDGAVVVREGKIAEVVRGPGGAALPEAVFEAGFIAPGFIDLQVNGGFDREVRDDPAAIAHLSALLPSTGVTAFLPTLISSAAQVYPRACEAFLQSRGSEGALPLGLHLEGPFLSLRRAGAHREDAILGAPADVFDVFLRRDVLRLVTLAPEVPGAADRIRRLRSQGVVVSLGHTDASYEECLKGVEAGATMVTHLYNAMSPFRHRTPGVVGAALLDDRVTAGIIPDGFHCHEAAFRLALRTKTPGRITLVTDAMAGLGMPPGIYHLGGQAVHVADGVARLTDGRLAGSVLAFDQGIRNLVRWGVPLADASRMASETPARLLGLSSKGSLERGLDADLVLLDADLRVSSTFREGRCLYRRRG